MRMRVLVMVLVVGGAASPLLGQHFLGDDFQVNSSTIGGNRYAAVSGTPRGTMVVVWERLGGTPFNIDVMGRRYSIGGAPLGGEFQVNVGTTGDQEAPAVAMAPNGGFMVVWQSDVSSDDDSSGTSIQAVRFNSDGTPFTSEIQVNTYTTGNQTQPSVAAVQDGGFVVVWQSEGSGGSDHHLNSVQLQRLDHNGGHLGSQVQVNGYTSGHQSVPTVAVDADGSFVVAWSSGGSYGSDSSDRSIQCRRYDSAGAPLGSELQVNTYTTSTQINQSLDVDDEGNFVVVWSSLNQDGDFLGVFGQRFASDGSPTGSEFQVNTLTTGAQTWPAVTTKPDGEFVVVWQSDVSAGADLTDSIQGQMYAADGQPVGAQFQVNSSSSYHEVRPAAFVNDRGIVFTAWKLPDVSGRRFFAGLFYDGFESGGTSSWSATTP